MSDDPEFGSAQETLLPCPFCGGEAKVRESKLTHDTWFVQCVDCENKTVTSYHKIEPTEAWNARVSAANAPTPVAWLYRYRAYRGSKADEWATEVSISPPDFSVSDLTPLYTQPHSPAAHATRLDQLEAFVRQVANCEQSDNQNIRRAKELCASEDQR